MDSDLCLYGRRLAYICNNICVKANGDCTDLYWHISECEECAKLRDKDMAERRSTQQETL
jgi:hypothetical protein